MSEDLIKRSDAIETAYQLRRKPNDEEWDWWLRSFNAIPSADRPQGEWIWHEDEDICNCSRCNFEIDAEGCIEPMEYVGVFHYCPNCGAKMKGADDE